ncbi:MAG: hypothetical protein JSS27_02575 [Planctomycetes bacterium]|nr:hypothetical protein [Planctomycetota bacterium]
MRGTIGNTTRTRRPGRGSPAKRTVTGTATAHRRAPSCNIRRLKPRTKAWASKAE